MVAAFLMSFYKSMTISRLIIVLKFYVFLKTFINLLTISCKVLYILYEETYKIKK